MTVISSVASAPDLRARGARLARRGVVWLALLAIAGVGWGLFAPQALGGRTSYVITDGISMLPKFHANGLVITRSESAYQVGEVVAYHNHDLGRVVMHRIVATDGSRYIFKGDNNNFQDSYHPTKADLVGKEWIYWPGGGRWFQLLRSPLLFAILLAAAAFVAVRTSRNNRSRNRRRRRVR